MCTNILQEEKFDVKCFQVDRAMVYLDQLKYSTINAQEDDDLSRAYDYSQTLYQVIYQQKDQILAYEANSQTDQNEQDLIDLILMTEIVAYSVLSINLTPNQIDNQQQELSNSVDKLVAKMNDLTLNSPFLE